MLCLLFDYTSALKDVILETESGVGGLTYRYVYGLEKVNTVITGVPNGAGSVMQYVFDDLTGEFVLTTEDPGKDVVKNNIVKLWYHQDRLGSTDFLTDNVKGKVTSFVSYDDWGAPTMKAILRMGVRELDLVTEYTGHPYDEVLGIYFAEARMYDASDRRFMAEDWVKGSAKTIQSVNRYIYVYDNPVKYIDPLGLEIIIQGSYKEIVEIRDELRKLSDDAITISFVASEAFFDDFTGQYIGAISEYKVVISENENVSREVGTGLLRELDDYAEKVTITKFNFSLENDSQTRSGTFIATGEKTSSVYIDLYDAHGFHTVGKNGNISKNNTTDYNEFYIDLGHELIHAQRWIAGISTIDNDDDYGMTSFRKSLHGPTIAYIMKSSELETAGIPYYPLLVCKDKIAKSSGYDMSQYGEMIDPNEIYQYTENKLRAENNLPLRIEYAPSSSFSSLWIWKERVGDAPRFIDVPDYLYDLLNAK